jgi:hypothetical protein
MEDIMKTIFPALLLVICTCISCAKANNPVVSDSEEKERNLSIFQNFYSIFPEVGQTGIFYDADISEILVGPDPEYTAGDPGELWLDSQERSWSVAVALEETGTNFDTDRKISFRFLGPNIMSHAFRIEEIEGNIRLARVAACYFEGEDPDNEDDTFVEVTIAYQMWNVNVQEWEIHVYRMGINPDLFTNLNWTSGIFNWEGVDEVFLYNTPGSTGYGQMMPDVAYDPNNGNLYVVMTRYETDTLPRIWMRSARRWHLLPFQHRHVQWLDTLQCQFGLNENNLPNHGFHPRIDIGLVTLFPFPESSPPPAWHLAIVYTGDSNQFVPFFSFWPVGPCPGYGNFDEIKIELWDGIQAGFMPVIDIGLPDTDHCAIAWTQTRSESWNDVTVGYLDSHYGNFFVEEASGLVSSAFPSVSVRGQYDDVFETSLFFLESDNPNSLDWAPSYRHQETWWEGWELNWDLGIESNLNLTFLGDYDSGSQFSNWYGMSSSITSVNNNCWVIWSSHQELNDDWQHLTTVYGAYGNTE